MYEMGVGEVWTDPRVEDQSIDQLSSVIDLVSEGRAGVARARVAGVIWTWAVARRVQARAREREVMVWLVEERDDGQATVEISRRGHDR